MNKSKLNLKAMRHSAVVILAEGLAFKLSIDFNSEMFEGKEYELARVLDPCFKGIIETILPPVHTKNIERMFL